MNFIHKLYDRFERRLLIGNRHLQWLFEGMYRLSLRGMNYEQVQSLEESGELFILKNIQKWISNTDQLILFDVGANIGSYSKLLTQEFKNSTVFAFEPSPLTFEILKSNLNAFTNINCYNVALGAKEENRTFYYDAAGSPLASFYPSETKKLNSDDSKIVSKITSLDSFCAKENISEIHFLKIDVEGFEYEVLKGAEKMIGKGKIKFIQFEFGGNHIESGARLNDIFKILNKYTISRVLKNGLRPYAKYDKSWEIYMTANYFAVLN